MTQERGKSLKKLAEEKAREGVLQNPEIYRTMQDAEKQLERCRGMEEGELLQELIRMKNDPDIRSSIDSGQMAAALARLMPMLDSGQRQRLQDVIVRLGLS